MCHLLPEADDSSGPSSSQWQREIDTRGSCEKSVIERKLRLGVYLHVYMMRAFLIILCESTVFTFLHSIEMVPSPALLLDRKKTPMCRVSPLVPETFNGASQIV